MTSKTDGLMCLVVDVPGETREQFEAVMAHLATERARAAGGGAPARQRRAGRRLADGERVGERGGDGALLRGVGSGLRIATPA